MASKIKSKLQDMKRDLILEEAALLFESIGFEQLKVSDLAKSVGVSVGTIYGMFESKEGLYMAYVRKQIAVYVQELEMRCEGITSDAEQLKIAFELKCGHFVSKRKAVEECAKNNPLFFSNIRHSSPDILSEVYDKLSQMILNINPKLNSIEAEKLAYAFTGLSDGYIAHWLMVEDDLMAEVEKMHSQMMLMIKESA